MTEEALRELDVLVGEWATQAAFPDAPPSGSLARTVFEWMTGGRLLVQRWEVDVPEAPDGIAIIGVRPDGDGYLQHYFDSRGVVRVYEMTLGDGVWELLRVKPDFSPLDFSQRFIGRFSEDGVTIDGRWETSDDGSNWRLDFELAYTRV
jgi:hypothetical protein